MQVPLKEAFDDNFFLTKEYATFCSKSTGILLEEEWISQQKVYLLKHKNIAVSNYDEDLVKEFKKNKIRFMQVSDKLNTYEKDPSLIEYAIFHKKSYEEAVQNYKHSFKEGLRQSKKYPLSVTKVKKPTEHQLAEAYKVYRKQMKRLNSFAYPQSYFQAFIQMSTASLFLVYYQQQVTSYAFCFENKKNFYFSISGSDQEYFKYRVTNRLYDAVIHYACEQGLTIHFGTGIRGSGYQKFKENAGALIYKCERFPNDERYIRAATNTLKFKGTGLVLRSLSKLFPKRVIYTTMPTT